MTFEQDQLLKFYQNALEKIAYEGKIDFFRDGFKFRQIAWEALSKGHNVQDQEVIYYDSKTN
jgi:hypothetical protein